MRLWWAIAIAAFALAAAPLAQAHEIRPVFLSIQEIGPAEYDVLWKRPKIEDVPIDVTPSYPNGCQARKQFQSDTGAALDQRLRIVCSTPMIGRTVGFDGLSRTMTDGLVRWQGRDGRVQLGVVQPDRPTFFIAATPSWISVVTQYFRLGVTHILTGYDHLLFVTGLLLLVGGLRRVMETITAFTVAHSLTLAAVVLGFLTPPVAPIEATIALSIAFLAMEVLKSRNAPAAAWPGPMSLAFGFGLLHGMGFASGLAEIGLPRGDVPLALLGFNLGVEAGQLGFILVLLTSGQLLRLVSLRTRRHLRVGLAYAMGAVAMFWTIQRISAF